MRLLPAVLIPAALLAACAAPVPPPAPRIASEAAARQGVRAAFPARPERLLAAAAAACNGPGQQARRPDPDSLRCESLPTPEVAAGRILGYGGTVEDLPRVVIRFAGADSGGIHVVTADSFIVRREPASRRSRCESPTPC
jgi:hypothetical protein